MLYKVSGEDSYTEDVVVSGDSRPDWRGHKGCVWVVRRQGRDGTLKEGRKEMGQVPCAGWSEGGACDGSEEVPVKDRGRLYVGRDLGNQGITDTTPLGG